MMTSLFSIALGGAFGALARHGVNNASAAAFGLTFPWGTLIANIFGSLLMGVLISVLAHVWSPPQEMKAFLTVGFLGAFTTFSTFSLDAVTLYERGQVMEAGGYVLASVILSIAALFIGMLLVRQVVL